MEGLQDDAAALAFNSKPQHMRDIVRVVHVLLVKPAKPTVRHFMYMSPVDQMFRKAKPSRTILFYLTDIDRLSALEALRQGLASTLVAFYPMAGRLLEEGNRLALDCNDQGVELIESCCNLPFVELERDRFPIQPLFRQLVPMDSSESSDVLENPLASFQVTSFAGGLTVGIAISHCVADGLAMWSFIRAVSQACRGEPLSVSPLHARTLLKPEVFMTGIRYPDVPSNHCTRSTIYNGCEETVRANNLVPELLQQKVIHFSQEMIHTLKQACLSPNDHTDKASHISTFQALAAYLWKRLTMAQRLDDKTMTDMRLSMDVRHRMIPPLTAAFFGNAVIGIPTPASAGEVTRESLGVTAARIRQSIRQGDDMYIKDAIVARENADLRKIALSPVKVILIRNATGFPVYEGGDFGWGEPEAVRPPWDWKEGEFTWYPGKKAGSVDVMASLTETTCAHFFSPRLFPDDPLRQSAFPFALDDDEHHVYKTG